MLTDAVKTGTFYKMRDGRKAYVAHIGSPSMHTEHPAIGLYEIEPGMDWTVGAWRLDGTRNGATSYELMEVWVDPPPLVEAFVLAIRASGEILYVGDTREDAQRVLSTYSATQLYRIAHVVEVQP